MRKGEAREEGVGWGRQTRRKDVWKVRKNGWMGRVDGRKAGGWRD